MHVALRVGLCPGTWGSRLCFSHTCLSWLICVSILQGSSRYFKMLEMCFLCRKQRVPKARALRFATGLNLGKRLEGLVGFGSWFHFPGFWSLQCVSCLVRVSLKDVQQLVSSFYPDLGNLLQGGSLSIRHRHSLSRLNLAFSWCVLDDVQRLCVPSSEVADQ